MRRIFSRLSIVAIVVAAAGCGGSDSLPVGEMAPVKGTVTVDGNPVTSGQVSLIPIDQSTQLGGSVCAGTIDSTGGYVIHTAGKAGAPIGRYKVTITPSMLPSGDNKMPTLPFDMKYSNMQKTTIVFNVEKDAPPGRYDIKLTK